MRTKPHAVPAVPVIFRAEKAHGELWITAVFPTFPGTNDPHTFTIYQHIGQHGSGSREWYTRTRRATPEEYRSLLKELISIYAPHPLIVVQRMTRRHFQIRKAMIIP